MTNFLKCSGTLLLCFTLSFAYSQIPSPTETLGFEVGAHFHLATYEQSVAYLRKLEAASDSKVVQISYTSQQWYCALILSSKQNLG